GAATGAPAAGGGSAVGGRAVAVGGNVAPGGGSVAPGGPDGDAASGAAGAVGAGAGAGACASAAAAAGAESAVLDPDRACLRPRLYWFNAALTVALLVLLIAQLLPIPVLFLLGAALALTVNFRDMADQKARIAAHAENVLNVSGMVFAAAVFTGVLTGTGMVDEMARSVVGAVPDALGPHMALVTGVLSIPFTYLMSNDGFYFGIVPILSEAGAAHGVSSLEIARASLVGQPLHMSSPLVPAVYVLVGMAKVEFGEHTRFTIKWAVLTSLSVLAAGFLFGIL
uniref:citrate:proton symporter n=1 Tax=Streptomyces sp. PU-14G TaxID=2800808 RepID=UPI0034DF2742